MNHLPSRLGRRCFLALLACLFISTGWSFPDDPTGRDRASFARAAQDATPQQTAPIPTGEATPHPGDSLQAGSTPGKTSLRSFEDQEHPTLDAFFLVLFPLLSFLLFFIWKFYKDLRPLSLALLASAASLQVLLGESVAAPHHAVFVVLSSGLIVFALSIHFPHLLHFRWLTDHLSDLPCYEIEMECCPQGSIPLWLRSIHTALLVGTLVLASLLLPALLATLFFDLAWPLTTVVFFLPLLLLPPVVVLLVLALRKRRLMVLGTVLILASLFSLIVSTRALGMTSSLLSYSFYLALSGSLLVQVISSLHRSAKLLREGRVRVKQLLRDAEQAADEIKELTIQSQAAKVAKTQFVSSVSHELRTPLTAIRGYAQVLREDLTGTIEPIHDEFLETIEMSCDRLTAVVNDLLDMAKVESGRIDVKLTDVDLRQQIDEIITQLFPLADTKGLILLRPKFEVEDLTVHADELRLRQVLINLLSNAIKFTQTGCVGIRVYSAVLNNYETLFSEPACAIEVFDTGVGISPDFLGKVFEPFLQEERVYSDTQRGTGLGLAITRAIVARMAGQITVSSTLNEGTVFTVLLAGTQSQQTQSEAVPNRSSKGPARERAFSSFGLTTAP